MKNSVYWQKRAEQVLIEAERNTNAYLNELNRTYKNTVQSIDNQINKIFGTYNKGFTQKQAIEWLNEEIPIAEYNKLKEVLPLITDENYRKQLLMQLNAPAYRYRITRLQQIKQTVLTELSKVADIQLKLSQQCFVDTLKHSYSKTMFNIQQGTGLAFEFAQLPQSSVNRLLSAKWYGRNFSGSIWRNRGIVVNEASKLIKQGVLSGQSIQQMSKAFMEKTYTDSMYNATRLIRTEVNYFCNQGTLESYREAELDQYEYCATLDLRTSNICRQKDGIVFPLEKAVAGENYPPLHPYCRSTVIPVINAPGLERMNKRRVRNPVTGKNEVIDNMSYSDWYNKYIKANPKAVIAEKMKKNKISDTKQYEKYKAIFGKDMPKSIDKFQDLKYNNSEEWGILKAQYKGMTFYNNAITNEPHITKIVLDISDKAGMNTAGLEYRIKGKKSYLRKIRSNYDPDGNEYEIKDILRYTYTSSSDKLADSTLAAISELQKIGYETIQVKNTWNSKINPYRGINTIVKAPNGQKFEIQYHTAESFTLKNGELHTLYEKARLLDNTSQQYIELCQQMTKLSNQLTVPLGIERVKKIW